MFYPCYQNNQFSPETVAANLYFSNAFEKTDITFPTVWVLGLPCQSLFLKRVVQITYFVSDFV